jgi:hypothetical protein
MNCRVTREAGGEGVDLKGWTVGRDGSVGIATRYGLDGPGIASRRTHFSQPSKTILGPPQVPVQWVKCPFIRGKAKGA